MSSSAESTYSDAPGGRVYASGFSASGRIFLDASIHAIAFRGSNPATGWEEPTLNLTPVNLVDRPVPTGRSSSSRTRRRHAIWMPSIAPPLPIANPSEESSMLPLEKGCVVCSSTYHLSLCPDCECAYVCRDHNPYDNPHHKNTCKDLIRARRALCRGISSFIGRQISVTRIDFRAEQCEIANNLVAMNTQLSLEKAVSLYYQLTQTSCLWSRFFEARFVIPRELFRLGRLEECYHYVKFWTRFAGLRQRDVKREEYVSPSDWTSIWEEDMRPIVRRGGGTTLNCLLMVLLIKLSLWLNIKEMQSAWCVGRRKGLAYETISAIQEQIACPTILNNEDIYKDIRAIRSLIPHIRKLNKEVIQLRDAIIEGNDVFWPILLNRDRRTWKDVRGGGFRPVPEHGPPASFLRQRDTMDEAVFAVYNNKSILGGHLGKAVEFVLSTRYPKLCTGGMYGPGKGWLDD